MGDTEIQARNVYSSLGEKWLRKQCVFIESTSCDGIKAVNFQCAFGQNVAMATP